MSDELKEPYDRIQRFADKGVVPDASLESAKIEALCNIAVQLKEVGSSLQGILELMKDGFVKVDAG